MSYLIPNYEGNFFDAPLQPQSVSQPGFDENARRLRSKVTVA